MKRASGPRTQGNRCRGRRPSCLPYRVCLPDAGLWPAHPSFRLLIRTVQRGPEARAPRATGVGVGAQAVCRIEYVCPTRAGGPRTQGNWCRGRRPSCLLYRVCLPEAGRRPAHPSFRLLTGTVQRGPEARALRATGVGVGAQAVCRIEYVCPTRVGGPRTQGNWCRGRRPSRLPYRVCLPDAGRRPAHSGNPMRAAGPRFQVTAC